MPAPGDLDHLVPAARAAALLPDAERLTLLRTERWWVAHDQARAALARLDALLRDGPGQIRPPNLLLAGPTNTASRGSSSASAVRTRCPAARMPNASPWWS